MGHSLEFDGVRNPSASMSRATNDDSGASVRKKRAGEGLGLGWGVVSKVITAGDFSTLKSMETLISSNSSVSSSSDGLGDDADEDNGGGSNQRADAFSFNGARSANSPSCNQVVGWPPIRTCRRNNLVNLCRVANSGARADTHDENITLNCSSNIAKEGICGNDVERKALQFQKSRFVKVNMDGDPIGRKVDLHAHACYETLFLALEAMFQKPNLSPDASANGNVSKLLDGSSELVLVYEDDDGDCMLIGDVPWGMFLCSARRLRIMKIIDTSCHDKSANTKAAMLLQ